MLKIKQDRLSEKDKGFIDDAIIVIMHLCHTTIHAEMSYLQTGDEKFLKIANESRKDRTELLDLITKEEGELWCYTKHTLIVVVGYTELAIRCLSAGDEESAKIYYAKSSKWLESVYRLNKLRK